MAMDRCESCARRRTTVPSETMRTKAREWLYSADHPNKVASAQEVDDLATLLDAVRDLAIEESAKVCESEARACLSHAKAFSDRKERMKISEAHEMAGKQNEACAHYVRQLKGLTDRAGRKEQDDGDSN
jgi:DNA polymerase/3'-5' exonuclease PolX